MFPEERYKYILDKINEKGSVKVEKLVKELSVSSMTIHRDLDELERRGLVIKKYGGGIKPTDLLEEKTNVQKLELNMKEKDRIAGEALKLISNNEVIFLDAGTTNLRFAEKLLEGDFKKMTILTNDLQIATILSRKKSINVIMVGGAIDKKGALSAGYFCLEFLKNFILTKAFIGTQALSSDFLITTANENIVGYKRLLVEKSKTSILLCDSSKFNEKRMYLISPLSKIDILISDKSNKELLDYCEGHRVKLLEA